MIQRNQDFCRKRRKEKQSRSGKEESGGETHITSRFWDVWKETVSTWGCRGSRVLRKARLQLEQKGKENIQNRGAAQISARVLPGCFVPLSFFWFFIYHWSNWDIILDSIGCQYSFTGLSSAEKGQVLWQIRYTLLPLPSPYHGFLIFSSREDKPLSIAKWGMKYTALMLYTLHCFLLEQGWIIFFSRWRTHKVT